MCLDHMQRIHVFGGLYHYPKYGWNQCRTFWWYASFNISRVWLEGAYWWLWPLNTDTKVHHGDHEKAITVAKAHHPKHTICGPTKKGIQKRTFNKNPHQNAFFMHRQICSRWNDSNHVLHRTSLRGCSDTHVHQMAPKTVQGYRRGGSAKSGLSFTDFRTGF